MYSLMGKASKGSRTGPIVVALAAGGMLTGALSTTAQADVAPDHVVSTFVDRDFVSAEGYPAGAKVTVTVNRAVSGTLVAVAHGVVGADSIVEVNHPGGACWEPPSAGAALPADIIQRGDLVTITGAGTDTSRAQNVTAGKAVYDGAAKTLVVKGTAQAIDPLTGAAQVGVAIPAARLRSRLVAAKGTQFTGTRNSRVLRNDKDYGAPAPVFNGINWTVTYKGVSLADGRTAETAQSRGLLFTPDPAAPTEITQSETDVANGPGC